jgi:hypothetical protein
MKKLIFSALLYSVMTTSSWAQTKTATAEHIQVVANEKEKRADIVIDGKPFTSYIYPGPEVIKKAVLFPLRTANGTVVTRGYPLEPRPNERIDHPHHVGMWFNYGDVNGHDFWNNSNAISAENKGPFGTIVHTGVKKAKGGKDTGELTVTADWLDKDSKPILQETTTFYFSGSANSRTIDRITTLKALDKQVVFKDNKEGLLGIRVARELEHPSTKPELFTDANGKVTDVPLMNNEGVSGLYRTSEGVEGDKVWGTRAKWTNLTGKINGEPVSIAILDHPGNVGYPTYWHARGYGLYAANPLGQKIMSSGKEELNYTLPAGKSVTFRYRVVIISADKVTDEALNKEFDKFSKTK